MQMQHKAEFHARYDIAARLGKGQFSTVYELIEKATQARWAGKVVNKLACPASALETELSILNILNHPQTVKIKEVFTSDEVCIIVMELVTGGELFDRISEQGVFTEKYASTFFRDLLHVVKYLHDQKIVHRDLKPENIMLSDRTENAVLKVIDFGASKYAANDKAITGIRGTPPYMAPEIFAYQSYGRPVDVWALGVILYVILSGMFPYDPDQRTFEVPFCSPEFDDISESAKELLLKLLDTNVEARYTVDQALAHPWVTGEKASDSKMSVSNLRGLVARKRFKRAIETVRLVNKFRGLIVKKESKQAPSELKQSVELKRPVDGRIHKISDFLDGAEKSLQSAIDQLNSLSQLNADATKAGQELQAIKLALHQQSKQLKTALNK